MEQTTAPSATIIPNVDYTSAIWTEKTVSEVFILPHLGSDDGIRLLLQAIEHGLNDCNSTSTTFADMHRKGVDGIHLAETYLDMLSKQEDSEMEIEMKEPVLQQMRTKLQRITHRQRMLMVLRGKFEQMERLAISMLASQQNQMGNVNAANVVPLQCLIVAMKCIDRVWAEIQAMLKMMRDDYNEDQAESVHFIAITHITEADGSKSTKYYDLAMYFNGETESM